VCGRSLHKLAFINVFVRLIKMCVREMCNGVHIGEHLSDAFPIYSELL
jgi:hypothetical protein